MRSGEDFWERMRGSGDVPLWMGVHILKLEILQTLPGSLLEVPQNASNLCPRPRFLAQRV